MSFAEASFADLVAEGQAAIVVAQIQEVVGPEKIDEETLGGVVKLQILNEITQPRLSGAKEISVRFAQYSDPTKRVKWPVGWNTIEVKKDTFVLVGIIDVSAESLSSAQPLIMKCASVRWLESPEDSFVRGVEKALQIEETQDIEQRKDLVKQGLYSELEFFADYSHYAAGRLGRIPRSAAVTMELTLLTDDSRPTQDRIDALVNLELELYEESDPGDELNKRIVGAFLKTLEVQDKEYRRMLLQAIYRMLVLNVPEGDKEATEYRTRLMRGVSLPSKDALLAAVSTMEGIPDVQAEAVWVKEFIATF